MTERHSKTHHLLIHIKIKRDFHLNIETYIRECYLCFIQLDVQPVKEACL